MDCTVDLRMSTFFRGITETVTSLFRGIFSERNSVAHPMLKLSSEIQLQFNLCFKYLLSGFGPEIL
jgi:hypothetical protein